MIRVQKNDSNSGHIGFGQLITFENIFEVMLAKFLWGKAKNALDNSIIGGDYDAVFGMWFFIYDNGDYEALSVNSFSIGEAGSSATFTLLP